VILGLSKRSATLTKSGDVIGTRRFQLPHGLEFELPADWWTEAGMAGFQPNAAAYRAADELREIKRVPLKEIAPQNMGGRQHLDFGGFDRKRMVSILRAIAQGYPLPPIEIVERPEGQYRYKLCNGTHRFYGSAAAGFPMIPTVEGWLPETDAITISN
jgi:hypothetical protein